MIDPATGLAIAGMASDFLGGQQDDQADQQQRIQDMIARRQAMQEHWNEMLMEMGQRASEQGDERAMNRGRVAGREALLPLMDRGFTGITQRFAQGPAVFGQVGAQNRAMQTSSANYRPGQNPSINAYGNDLEAIRQRFAQRPVFDNDEERRRLAARGPVGGWNGR